MIKDFLETLKLKETFNTKGLQQRGIGDLIEYEIIKSIQKNKKENYEIILATGAKSTGDISIKIDNVLYLIDIKTFNTDSKYSMPNLISFDKLVKDVIKKDNVKLIYLFIHYKVVNNELKITNIKSSYINNISSECLRFGNLGSGQLQIKNAKKLSFNNNQTEKDGYVYIIKLYKEFLNNLTKKIQERQNKLEDLI